MSHIQVDLQQVEYDFICRVAERVVGAGGLIFGGFLRDKLLHDHHKKGKGYVDAVPRNLDVVFTGDLSQLFERLIADDVDLHSVIDNRQHPLLRDGTRYSIDLTMRNSSQIVGRAVVVQLDLFCARNTPMALLRNPDLECNLLICDAKGIRTPRIPSSIFQQWEDQQGLVERILARITRVIPAPDGNHRSRLQSAVKMMLRGWTVENVTSFHLTEMCPAIPSGICVFCQDHLPETRLHLNCCMKYAHAECFQQFLAHPERGFFSQTSCRHQSCLELTS